MMCRDCLDEQRESREEDEEQQQQYAATGDATRQGRKKKG